MAEITFTDVLIEPNYSEIESRSDVDLSSDFGRFKLKLPVLSANMKHITGAKMAYNMNLSGALGILHRFNSTEDAIIDFQSALTYIETGVYDDSVLINFKCKARTYEAELAYSVGVSIGVKESDKERFMELHKHGARLFCIDVAHGHHINMRKMLEWIRKESGTNSEVVIIAGNVATARGAIDLHTWGADIIKVGIGPGAVCQTRKNTGAGVPQLQALKDIREAFVGTEINIKIIADGGIKSTGDIAKAYKYADAVMVGSFLSGSSETPGDVYENPDGEFYKIYGGSASGENKVSAGRENKFVEGMMTTVPFRGHVKYILKRIRENVQSAFSYAGAATFSEFQKKAVLRIISGGGRSESKI